MWKDEVGYNEMKSIYTEKPFVCPRCKRRHKTEEEFNKHFDRNPKCSLRAIGHLLPVTLGHDIRFHNIYKDIMELSK